MDAGPEGVTYEQFRKIIALAKSKQEEMMTEEILTQALRPLEEQKIYDDGEIGQIILGG